MIDPPTASGDGVLERTADGGAIRFERNLPYPIDEVWDAITNPERLAEWWLPFDADITVELREGGQMVFAGRGDQPVMIEFTILRVEPPGLLEHTHVDAGSHVRWELESIDAGCILRLSHFVTDTEQAFDNRYLVGLHTSLDRLAPCLAGHPAVWDWDRFAETQAHYASLGLAPPLDPP